MKYFVKSISTGDDQPCDSLEEVKQFILEELESDDAVEESDFEVYELKPLKLKITKKEYNITISK